MIKNDIVCGICGHQFEGKCPQVGSNITCLNCGSEGYGTYTNDENMFYMIEWCEKD